MGGYLPPNRFRDGGAGGKDSPCRMANQTRRNCVTCGGHDSVVGTISWAGNCRECGHANLVDNIVGIATKSGDAHRRRLRGIERYVQRARLDAAETSP